jgi:hypothetical protein
MTEEAWNVAVTLVLLARQNTKQKTQQIIDAWIREIGGDTTNLKEAAYAFVESYGEWPKHEQRTTETSNSQ